MYLESVIKFNNCAGVPSPDVPNISNSELNNLRLSLLIEEIKELQVALGKDDSFEACVEVLDALCDIQYILSGTIAALGFKKWFPKAFIAVHDNNMSKFFNASMAKVEESKLKPNTKIKEIKVSNVVTKYAVVNENGKVVKPSFFEPVNLQKLRVLGKPILEYYNTRNMTAEERKNYFKSLKN